MEQKPHWWEEWAMGNVVSLYGAHIVNYIVPLFTIPYLVRVLGPSAWGLVAMALGLGNYLNLVVEYGFGLSATRELARNQESTGRIAELVCGVTMAKLALAAAGIGITLVLQAAIPGFVEHRAILWAGAIAGISLGLNPMWYFQGRERMHIIASLDVTARLAAAAGVFLFVHGPADAWRVPGLQAAAALASTAAGLTMAWHEIPMIAPRIHLVRGALRDGWSMFLFRSSAMLYTSGNAFLLGLFAPPAIVGYFAGAEKIAKAFMGMFNPLNQALYPRLSRLIHESPERAAKLFRWNAGVVAAGGVVLGGIVSFGAPLLVRILLGPAMGPSVPVLRMFAILPALIGINTVLGTQWMAPLGMDGVLTRIIASAGILNLCLAATLAPRYQQAGMAVAVITAELFVLFACCLVLWRRNAGVGKMLAPSLSVPDLENSI